jgi:hypothetical protein
MEMPLPMVERIVQHPEREPSKGKKKKKKNRNVQKKKKKKEQFTKQTYHS